MKTSKQTNLVSKKVISSITFLSIFFIVTLSLSFISAEYKDCSYGNCKANKLIAPINYTTLNVTDASCWQGHCNNDASWLTGISTYNSSYVPYNGATQELNLNGWGLNTAIMRAWEDYAHPANAQKFSQQQPSQIFMGYWNGTAFRDYWSISYVDSMSKDLKISSTSSTVSLLIRNTIKSYNITSATTNTYSLGSSSVRWLKGWFSGLDVNGTINAENNYSIGGVNGLTKTIQIVKDVDLVGLTKTYCNQTFTGGLLTATTC